MFRKQALQSIMCSLLCISLGYCEHICSMLHQSLYILLVTWLYGHELHCFVSPLSDTNTSMKIMKRDSPCDLGHALTAYSQE